MRFLSRPVAAVDNAYFDGYMMVKRLYLDLSQTVPALADADLFLSFLRSYVFEDYGMVAILTGEDNNTFHQQVTVLERFGALPSAFPFRLRRREFHWCETIKGSSAGSSSPANRRD